MEFVTNKNTIPWFLEKYNNVHKIFADIFLLLKTIYLYSLLVVIVVFLRHCAGSE